MLALFLQFPPFPTDLGLVPRQGTLPLENRKSGALGAGLALPMSGQLLLVNLLHLSGLPLLASKDLTKTTRHRLIDQNVPLNKSSTDKHCLCSPHFLLSVTISLLMRPLPTGLGIPMVPLTVTSVLPPSSGSVRVGRDLRSVPLYSSDSRRDPLLSWKRSNQ